MPRPLWRGLSVCSRTAGKAPVELEAPWQEIGAAIDALLTRTISGKAVLHITP